MTTTTTLAERCYERYKDRITAVLSSWADYLKEQGYDVSEVYSDTLDEYRWEFVVCRDPGDDVVVSFTIAEERDYEGSDDAEGVNVAVDIVDSEGRILGQFCPYNYTPDVWVYSEDDFEERLEMAENLDLNALADTVSRR